MKPLLINVALLFQNLNMICINFSQHCLSDFIISANQNNKDGLKKATMEMKLKDRQDLVVSCNTCLSLRGHKFAQPSKE